jgi:hypothetical protein
MADTTIETQITRFGLSVERFVECVASMNEELFFKKLYEWTPRDIVAHLIGWNRYIIDGSEQIKRKELPFYDIDPGEDYSKVNAVLISQYSSRDKKELLDELRDSAHELIEYLGSMDPSEWARDYGVRHKEATVTIQNTIDEFIEDYEIHRKQIEDWLDKLLPVLKP